MLGVPHSGAPGAFFGMRDIQEGAIMPPRSQSEDRITSAEAHGDAGVTLVRETELLREIARALAREAAREAFGRRLKAINAPEGQEAE